MCLCLSGYLTACGTTRAVPDPEIVEVEKTVVADIPSDLTQTREKAPLFDGATYGDVMIACRQDRTTIDLLNQQLIGIRDIADEFADEISRQEP